MSSTAPARSRLLAGGQVRRGGGEGGDARRRADAPAVVAPCAARYQREVVEVSCRSSSAVWRSTPTTAASGTPCRVTTTSVPWAASAASRATPRGLASVTLRCSGAPASPYSRQLYRDLHRPPGNLDPRQAVAYPAARNRPPWGLFVWCPCTGHLGAETPFYVVSARPCLR